MPVEKTHWNFSEKTNGVSQNKQRKFADIPMKFIRNRNKIYQKNQKSNQMNFSEKINEIFQKQKWNLLEKHIK